MKRPLIKILIFLLCLGAVERFCYKQTSGFMVSKIETHLSPTPTWHVEPPSKEEMTALDHIFVKPFTFLGKGNECYAFVSADGAYVLKFFKHQLLRLPFLHEAILTLPHATFIKGLLHAREQRLKRSFISSKIAYEHFKEETGLVVLNVARDWKIKKRATLIDRLGIAHTIDLDQTEFIIQKRATLAPAHLKHLLCEGRLDEAARCLNSILVLLYRRAEKGFFDRDPRIVENFGFIGSRAVEIDIGSFLPDPKLQTATAYKKAFLYDVLEMKEWIKKECPDLLETLEESANNLLDHD